MTIPAFNKRGTLDKGIHECASEEFFERFCYGTNTVRSNYKVVLEQLFAFAISRNAKSIIIGGSFITNKLKPNDLDCLLIVPNEDCCNIQTNELLSMEECDLDILLVNENCRDSIYTFLNMFSKDRLSLDVGMVEIVLDEAKDKSTWDDYETYYCFESVLKAREAYIHRHVIRGTNKKQILVTICNKNEYLFWNYYYAPIVSSAGWIFSPFVYDNNNIETEVDNFKSWLSSIFYTYENELCIFADGIGTYLLARYLKDDSDYIKADFDKIILSKAILKSDFDWSKEINNYRINLVINLRDRSAENIIKEHIPNKLKKDNLFGQAYKVGFNDTNDKILNFEYKYSSNIVREEFKNTILPMYHMSTIIQDNIEKVCSENLHEIMNRELKLGDVTFPLNDK